MSKGRLVDATTIDLGRLDIDSKAKGLGVNTSKQTETKNSISDLEVAGGKDKAEGKNDKEHLSAREVVLARRDLHLRTQKNARHRTGKD